MKIRLLTAFALIILTATATLGQNIEPLDLAKRIFGNDRFKDIHKYVTGEYKGRPNGQDLRKGSILKFSLLQQTENKAVVAMTIEDTSGNGLDTYLFFEKNVIWKMNAFRGLALTGIIEEVKKELEKMTPEQVDSVINDSKKDEKSKKSAVFSSREDYDFQLGNAKLTLDLDENIIKHFLDNKTEFNRIKDSALSELKIKKSDKETEVELAENLEHDYHKLYVSSVSSGGYDFGNCINFLIGGMIDNSVGYLYIKDKKDLPEMSADRIIMIKEIGDGWYIYKTT